MALYAVRKLISQQKYILSFSRYAWMPLLMEPSTNLQFVNQTYAIYKIENFFFLEFTLYQIYKISILT